MRIDDMRELNEEELDEKLREIKEELFNLRFQHAIGQLDNPMKIRDTRRQMAKVLTVRRETELGIHREGS